MKTLLYTISDFSQNAQDCIDLLLSSIDGNNYDFCVLTNNQNINTKYNTIYDKEYNFNYIGALKYKTNLLPPSYDYYIYLDSDILYFDNIEKLLPTSQQNFAVVKETPILVGHNQWYFFDKVDRDHYHKLINSPAINAGSFIFDSSKTEAMFAIYDLYVKYHTNIVANDCKLEQSIYNYIMNKNTNFTNYEYCKDLTNTTELFACGKEKITDKKLYHFCGFSNEMRTKYTCMKDFYDKYKQQK